ncbi:hypothetical protein Pmar_PMAR022794, partial [Perkinsus marinus ATCC 50983]
VLIVDPAAHHSSLLPFRELASNYPLIRPASTGQIHAKTLPLCPVKGTASVECLEQALKKVDCWLKSTKMRQRSSQVMDYNRHHHNSAIPVVVLSACSNICGARLDIPTVSTLIHEYNGVVAWDLAAIAAHDKVGPYLSDS